MKDLQTLLYELGFKVDSLGYQYWIFSVNKSLTQYWKYSYKMEIVYCDVARVFNTTRNRVERCMRHASINAKENIRDFFKYQGKITSKVIMQLLINYYK